MNIKLRLALVLAIVIYYICLILLLKKKKLEIRYTLLWLFSGLLMAIVVAWPTPFEYLFSLIGIIEPTNGVFALAIFILIILLISMTAILSKMNGEIRELAQSIAQNEKRIRELEDEINKQK